MFSIDDLSQVTVATLRQFQFLSIVLVIIMQMFGKRLVLGFKGLIVWLVEQIAERTVPVGDANAVEVQDMLTNLATFGIGLAITMSLRNETYTAGDALLNALFASLLASGVYEYVKNVIATKGYKWK